MICINTIEILINKYIARTSVICWYGLHRIILNMWICIVLIQRRRSWFWQLPLKPLVSLIAKAKAKVFHHLHLHINKKNVWDPCWFVTFLMGSVCLCVTKKSLLEKWFCQVEKIFGQVKNHSFRWSNYFVRWENNFVRWKNYFVRWNFSVRLENYFVRWKNYFVRWNFFVRL